MNKIYHFDNYNFDIVKMTDQNGSLLTKEIFLKSMGNPLKVLLILGKTGVGKTHLANSCLDIYKFYYSNELKILDYPVTDLKADELYYCFFYESKDYDVNRELPEYMTQTIYSSKLFLLDDLGIEKQTEAGLFNNGFTKLLENYTRLIITSNLSLESIDKRYGRKIFSRLINDCQVVIINGEDYRLKGFRK
jgi:DNA replication protein DnaC